MKRAKNFDDMHTEERERERFSGRSYFIACVYSICKDIVTKDDDGDDDEREREIFWILGFLCFSFVFVREIRHVWRCFVILLFICTYILTTSFKIYHNQATSASLNTSMITELVKSSLN